MLNVVFVRPCGKVTIVFGVFAANLATSFPNKPEREVTTHKTMENKSIVIWVLAVLFSIATELFNIASSDTGVGV